MTTKGKKTATKTKAKATAVKTKAKLPTPEPPAFLAKVKLTGFKLADLDADGLRALRGLLHGIHRHVAALAYQASLQRYGNADAENIKEAAEGVKATLRPDVQAILY